MGWDNGCVHRRRCDAEESIQIPCLSLSGHHTYFPAATPARLFYPERPPYAAMYGQSHPARCSNYDSMQTRKPVTVHQSHWSVPPLCSVHAAVSGICECSPVESDSFWPLKTLTHQMFQKLRFQKKRKKTKKKLPRTVINKNQVLTKKL